MTQAAPQSELTESSPRHQRRAIFACIVAFAVFVAGIGIIYKTWLPRQNPEAMIVLQVDSSYRDSEVTVEATDGSAPVVIATVGPEDDYRLRFHVAPGWYVLTIRQHGKVIFKSDTIHARTMIPSLMKVNPIVPVAHSR